jgi:hypothetical protein
MTCHTGAARFLSGIDCEILADCLGALIQEQINRAIWRGANGDDRTMALIHSSLRQALALQLGTKSGFLILEPRVIAEL